MQISKRSNKEKEFAGDDLSALTIPDLSKVLTKCVVEESVSEDRQPLFIELRVLNQYCKTAKSHISMRRKLLGEDSAPSTQGLQKITDYFRPVL